MCVCSCVLFFDFFIFLPKTEHIFVTKWAKNLGFHRQKYRAFPAPHWGGGVSSTLAGTVAPQPGSSRGPAPVQGGLAGAVRPASRRSLAYRETAWPSPTWRPGVLVCRSGLSAYGRDSAAGRSAYGRDSAAGRSAYGRDSAGLALRPGMPGGLRLFAFLPLEGDFWSYLNRHSADPAQPIDLLDKTAPCLLCRSDKVENKC